MRRNRSQQDQLRCPNLNAVNPISTGLVCWIANSPVITPLFILAILGKLTCNHFCTCSRFCVCLPTFIESRIRDNFQLLLRSPLSFIGNLIHVYYTFNGHMEIYRLSTWTTFFIAPKCTAINN